MRKLLYEELKNSKVGVGVVDSHSPFLSLGWEDYLPSDIKKITRLSAQSLEDPWIARGIEVYYSPQHNEFYLREWEQDPRRAGGEKINRLRVI